MQNRVVFVKVEQALGGGFAKVQPPPPYGGPKVPAHHDALIRVIDGLNRDGFEVVSIIPVMADKIHAITPEITPGKFGIESRHYGGVTDELIVLARKFK